MAVYGVGIDLVKVDRISKSLDRWGERMRNRIFTEAELEACSRRKSMAVCLATRFAAKEAFVKALGRGMTFPVLWRDVEVRNDSAGKPEIHLSPRAGEFCRDEGITSWKLSLTDEGEYGAAVVILEC
ncbi:MAG: holo-ACP synthase [Syntrophobacteraceae bacterium]